MTQVFTNAKLGEENSELNEENQEINNGDGAQITIDDVAAEAAASISETNEIEDPSAEDDIITDDILVDYEVAADDEGAAEEPQEHTDAE